MEKEKVINDYKAGMGIYDICAKYHIGKLKLKKILAENGVELRKKGKQPMDKSDFAIGDYSVKKYEEHDGYHYVAIDKNSGVRYLDHMNRGGFLTSHIEKEYGVETPSLYERRKYYMKTGNYWWEQWFDIVEEPDTEYSLKCPYCSWGTNDTDNKSGAFTHHLTSTHGISISEHLKKYPEHAKLFKTQVKRIEKELALSDSDNYVVCPICGKKMEKITYSHLRNCHKIGMGEFRNKFPDSPILSKRLVEQAHEAIKLGNLVVSKDRFISSYEREIGDFISSLGIEYDANRQILIGREIDILISGAMLGIEFDGLKFHTEFFGKKSHQYHCKKTNDCNDKGYGLIHIFEDEYVNHKDIVLSKIKHMLHKDNELPKIAGRKVEVREIFSSDAKEFLGMYHIQGFYKSTVYLGAFYNGKIVAVMAFKHGNAKNEDWELTRFATDYHYRYQGVGSKMFSHFVKDYNPDAVVSFADRRWTPWSDNNLYTILGFTLDRITPPDYRYYNERVDRFKRIHKMSMSKSVLSKKYGFPMTMTELEMAKALGYDRIWDCGLFKYVWRKDDLKTT